MVTTFHRWAVRNGVKWKDEDDDISLRYVQQLEAGERNPSIPTLARLHRSLGCKWDDLFKGL